MKRKWKHDIQTEHGQAPVVVSDFSGGEVYAVQPTSLADNELQSMSNFEYDLDSGHPKVVDPFELYCDLGCQGSISRMMPNPFDNYMLVAVGTKLYKVVSGEATELVETLSSTKTPCYDMWDQNPRKLLIASGGKLQTYDGTTLADIDDTDCDIVFVRAPAGRIVIAKSGSDTLLYSGVGDVMNWTENTDQDALSLEVGYKDSGDITGIVSLPQDIAIFKSSKRVFRVVGEYPDWTVKEQLSTSSNISHQTIVRIGNDAVYLTAEGIQSLSATTRYGDIAMEDIGEKINTFLVKNVTNNAKLWHVPSKGQLWINPQGSTAVWVLHYKKSQAWTHIDFEFPVTDVVEVAGVVFVASGSKIYRQYVGDADGSKHPQATIVFKEWVFDDDVVVKRVILNMQPQTFCQGVFLIGGESLPFTISSSDDIAFSDLDEAYSDTDPLVSFSEAQLRLRCNLRLNNIMPQLIITRGSAALRRISIEIAR